MKVLNVGFVTTWFDRGAAQVSKQYLELLKDEQDVNYFVYARGGEKNGRGNDNWDHDYVTWADKISLPFPMAIDKYNFIKWLKSKKIDIVIFNEQQWVLPVIWAREFGCKTICYVDYYTEDTLKDFQIYNCLLCNTKRHYNLFKEHHDEVYYLPWGVDLLTLSDENIQNSNDRITFFHSCGYSPDRKGTQVLLEAFDRALFADDHLVIHTQIDLKLKMPDMKLVIDRLLSEDKLTVYSGDVPFPGLYKLGDIYVYPTKLEGIGLTIAEALVMGLPTIVPDCPPMNEFVTDPELGGLVKVSKLVSRADGYYWPQCLVSSNDLAQVMLQQRQRFDKAKTKVLTATVARERFNWNLNRNNFVNILHKVHFSTSSFNSAELLARIQKHNTKFQTICLKLYQTFPTIYRALSFIYNLRYCRNKV